MFSQKKAFLIFQETETPKKFFILEKKELPSIPRNGNPKKLFIFQEMDFLSPSLKDFLYFRKEFPKPENQKFPILFLIKKKHFRN